MNKAEIPVIEILVLTLRPGTREQFQRVYVSESLPMQNKWNIEVLAHGPSRHDENTYYVVRHFKSLKIRQELEDAFYQSDDWRKGPRTGILSLVEHIATLVVPADTVKEWAGIMK